MPSQGEPVLYSLYVYAPNQIAPIIFAVLYFVSFVGHAWQCYRYNAWKTIGIQPFCGILFVVGYALRAYGSHHYIYSETDQQPLMIYIMSQVFVYICPPLLELSNYHVLGRMFYYVRHAAPLAPQNVLPLFGSLMGIVEALNAVGVALSSDSSGSASKQSLGSHLTLASTVIQVVVILSFFILSGIFNRRVRKAYRQVKGNVHTRNTQIMFVILYLSMFLILVRCIYRLVEHTQNTDIDFKSLESMRALSPILRYEVFFLVFESSLLFINSAIWNVWHPGRFIPEGKHIYLQEDGTEFVGEPGPSSGAVGIILNILSFGAYSIVEKDARTEEPDHELQESTSESGERPAEDPEQNGNGTPGTKASGKKWKPGPTGTLVLNILTLGHYGIIAHFFRKRDQPGNANPAKFPSSSS